MDHGELWRSYPRFADLLMGLEFKSAVGSSQPFVTQFYHLSTNGCSAGLDFAGLLNTIVIVCGRGQYIG